MEIKPVNKSDKRFLTVALLVAALLFLYFGGGAMMNGGINGTMNEHGWMGGNSWGWLPAVFTFGLVVVIGWLLLRKKA